MKYTDRKHRPDPINTYFQSVATRDNPNAPEKKAECERDAFLRRRLFMIGDRHRKMQEEGKCR